MTCPAQTVSQCRYQQAAEFLDERSRRLFATNEALALGYGGVTATSIATGLARGTINDDIRDLRSGHNEIGGRIRRSVGPPARNGEGSDRGLRVGDLGGHQEERTCR
jgi:hypothetical protein